MTVTRYSEEELLEQERRTALESARLEEEMYNEEEEESSQAMYAEREESGEGQKKEPRISNFTAGFMIVFVLLVEGIQIALDFALIGVVVNFAITFFAQIVIAFWFWMKNVSFRSTKKIVTIGVSLLIEFIPVIDILPGFLVQTVAIILLTKAEDGALGKVASVVPGGEKLAGSLEKAMNVMKKV